VLNLGRVVLDLSTEGLEWPGKSRFSFLFLLRAIDQIETLAGILQVVAVKEMHVQDARLLDDETLTICMQD
jgi:hypothetical protein